MASAGGLCSPAAEIAGLERRIAAVRADAAEAARRAVWAAAGRALARLGAEGRLAESAEEAEEAAQLDGGPKRGSVQRLRAMVAEARQSTPPPAVEILVPEPERRGLTAGQLLGFFREHCGQVMDEGPSSAPAPVCKATKLAERCWLVNRTRRQALEAGSCHRLAPNLYAVNDLFIKPHTAERCISYAELLNPNGCPVDFFISHYWGEDFGEFTQSIYRHALSEARAHTVNFSDLAYWCCAFANNQHNVELGETLEESPFYQAMTSRNCRGTIMNLDYMASAFTRIWCVYEVHLTHLINKPFVINTSEGPLNVAEDHVEGVAGLRAAFVVHMNSVLQHVDVTEAESSNREDRRKILQSVAEFRSDDVGTALRGAEALNTTIKRLVAGQAIFILARMGDVDALRTALRNGARPDAMDSRGLRPLTYASGCHGSDSSAAQVLLDARAHPTAQVGAKDLLRLWSASAEQRKEALAALQCHPPEVMEFHAAALANAEESNQRRQLRERLQNLESEDENTRAAAVAALASLGEGAAPFAALVAARLADPSPLVRHAAVKALPRLGPAAAGPHVSHLAAALADATDLVRGAAMAALPTLRDAGQQALLQLLQGGTTRGRLAAMQVLPRCGAASPEHLAALRSALHEEDLGLRRAAIETLPRLGAAAEGLKGELAMQLQHKSAEIRRAAATSLARLSSAAETHTGELVLLLQDEDSKVRRAVMLALPQLGSAVLPFLQQVVEGLKDRHSAVRQATATTLSKLGSPVGVYAEEFAQALRRETEAGVCQTILEALPNIGVAAIAPCTAEIVERLGASSSKTRNLALEALLLLPEEAAAAALAAQLMHGTDHSRVLAATALLKMGPQMAAAHLDALKSALRDKEWRVRAAAAGLAALGEDRLGADCVDALAALLRDETWQVRAEAATLLPRLGRHASTLLPRFAEMTEDSGPDVRAAALRALVAAAADREQASAYAELLVARLSDKHARVRAAAVQALAELPSSRVRPYLHCLEQVARDAGRGAEDGAAAISVLAQLGH